MEEVCNLLINFYGKSDEAVLNFLDIILKDECVYVFSILLNCSDENSRIHTERLLSFAVNRSFVIEKEQLDESELIEYEERLTDTDGHPI